jgi:hypothetical protein
LSSNEQGDKPPIRIPFASRLRRWRFIIVGNDNELILLKVTDLLQAKQARALPV